jgi:hypothetical protein
MILTGKKTKVLCPVALSLLQILHDWPRLNQIVNVRICMRWTGGLGLSGDSFPLYREYDV